MEEKEYFLGKETVEETKDDSIYSEEVRNQLLEDDELTPTEAGFMKGYDNAYS